MLAEANTVYANGKWITHNKYIGITKQNLNLLSYALNIYIRIVLIHFNYFIESNM